jgi:hypothetical protein
MGSRQAKRERKVYQKASAAYFTLLEGRLHLKVNPKPRWLPRFVWDRLLRLVMRLDQETV